MASSAAVAVTPTSSTIKRPAVAIRSARDATGRRRNTGTARSRRSDRRSGRSSQPLDSGEERGAGCEQNDDERHSEEVHGSALGAGCEEARKDSPEGLKQV